METRTNQKERVRAAEILRETSQHSSDSGTNSLTEEALLAPRYLVPTFSTEEPARYSTKQLLATLAIGVLTAAFVALYIYGATVA